MLEKNGKAGDTLVWMETHTGMETHRSVGDANRGLWRCTQVCLEIHRCVGDTQRWEWRRRCVGDVHRYAEHTLNNKNQRHRGTWQIPKAAFQTLLSPSCDSLFLCLRYMHPFGRLARMDAADCLEDYRLILKAA